MAEMTPADVPLDILLTFSDAESHCWGEPTHGLRYAECCRRTGLAAVLEALRAQQGTPRVQYGVRYPDHATVSVAPDEDTARAWTQEYAALIGITEPARVQRRTVIRSATDWEDVDG